MSSTADHDHKILPRKPNLALIGLTKIVLPGSLIVAANQHELLVRWMQRLLTVSLWPEGVSSTLAIVVLILALLGTGAMYYESRSRLFRHRRIAEQSERASVEAQLRALQAQVEPALLFGTLRNIDALILDAPDEARAQLLQLNRYLRASLSQARGRATNVQTEFALLDAYIHIASARFNGRVRVSMDCAESCAALSLPPMLLQPLIEIALPESSTPDPAATGTIDIHIAAQRVAGRLGERLEVWLADSAGSMISAYRQQDSKLQEVADRLAMLFGHKASLRQEIRRPLPETSPEDASVPIAQLVMSVPIERTGDKHLDS